MGQKGTQPTGPPDPVIGVAILAAGASTRLGRPKQLVPYRGRPLLRHVARQALACRRAQVLVVVGGNADSVAPALDGLGLLVVRNPDWSEGAASSVRLCVRLAGRQNPAWDGLLFLTCDQPAVTTRHLEGMLETARSFPGRIVASQYAGTLGVPAFFPSRFFPDLSRLSGDVGAKRVIQRHLDATVPAPLPGGEVDVDVVEDLAGLESAVQKGFTTEDTEDTESRKESFGREGRR